ncbi:hypothetical protein CORC01_09453 [Colletotrichum orchidophilum]|uniref:Uncharacterized protein n=1 Tax=Colletotrichum orchidophilum TaxID=1209926 RepID=A0A1G4B1K4_9PEZI|nr:uncharacterized protein CORC01_09453 [Colletotrichum orchidophilum]OHE95308.1 hypothetical protein CORC01_09453 [Colletotrichum orchidophilum]
MPPSPQQVPSTRPRVTPSRIFLRLRDRLELLLERFVERDATAQAEFMTYKAHRDRRWLEKDMDGGPAAAALAAVSNTTEPRRRQKSPINQDNPTVAYALPFRDDNVHDMFDEPVIPKTRDKDKDKEKASGLMRTLDKSQTLDGKGAARQMRAPPQPRTLSRSSTLSSIIDSTFLGGGQRRRRRRNRRGRSDARPGYFDPDLSPTTTPPRAQTQTAVSVARNDDDRLEMNVPVEVQRRSWNVPIGSAR